MKSKTTDDLETIPGVGAKIARYMHDIGINSVADLKDKNVEKLYDKLSDFQAAPVDRCMLYVFRSSIYYASNKDHDPQLLNWWAWKCKE